MAEILFSRESLTTPQLARQCGLTLNHLSCGEQHYALMPYQPYLIDPNPSSMDRSIAGTLELSSNPKNLFELSAAYGPDDTVAIAEVMAKLHEYNIALAGAATTAYSNRMKAFGKAVQAYQDALLNYRDVVKSSDISASAREAAKKGTHNAFLTMQQQFRHELSLVTSGVRSRKGTPLTSATRGTNIARDSRSSRSIAKLNVMSTTQAHNLVRFSHYGKYLGNGLVVIDVGSRIGNVRNEYKAGGDWGRELFIESSSFGLSAATGLIAVNAGLYLIMAATPVGWVGLVVAGAAVAGSAAAASMGINHLVKENRGSWYDAIMKLVSSR